MCERWLDYVICLPIVRHTERPRKFTHTAISKEDRDAKCVDCARCVEFNVLSSGKFLNQLACCSSRERQKPSTLRVIMSKPSY